MRKLFGAMICIAANAIPLVGIMYFGWEPAMVLLIYWLEFAVIGFLTVPKILGARGEDDRNDLPSMRLNGQTVRSMVGTSPRSLAIRFIFRFGFSWVIYGAFVVVFVFYVDEALELSNLPVQELVTGLGALALFHITDYWMNFIGDGQHERTGPVRQFINPIIQIIPLHIAIIFGGFIGDYIGDDAATNNEMSIGVILVLVAGKTILDLVRILRQ